MKRLVSLFVLMLAAEMGIWSLGRAGYFNGYKILGETTGSVESRIASLERRVYQLEKTTGLVKTKTSTTVRESFVSLSGGSAEGYEWTKLSGSDFTFDLGLYGSGASVTWEGWMDNGLGSVRLYDDTNHRAVDGSEVMVLSGTKSSFYSKPLSIWRGQNQYHLEIKSLSGQVTVTQPRLKVVVR